MWVPAWLGKVRAPLAAWLGNRLALFAVVYLGLVVQLDIDHSLRPFPYNRFLDGWFRWDSGHYWALAKFGYALIPGSVQQSTNFWPLYPLLVRVVSWGVGDAFIAGLLVSNVALVLACVLLYRWAARRFGEDVAIRTVVLLLCGPFAFYFSAMYTESVFLLASVGAFYFSERRRWLAASLCAAAAGATRLVGVVVVLPVLLTYAEACDWKLSAVRRDVLWLLPGFAGTLGHVVFLHLRFGDGLAFLRSQWVPGWGDNSSLSRLLAALGQAASWRHLATGNFDVIALVNLGFGLFALLVCLASLRRLGIAVAAWAVLTMLISLRIWASSGRYATVVWPMDAGLALATARRPHLYQSLVVGMCLLQALLAFWFAHGHWVA